MLLTLWSVKGGSGTSTVAAGLAASMASGPGRGRVGSDVLLVDLAGDQPALLGLPRPDGPGVVDWLRTDRTDAAALRRLEVEVATGLSLVPTGGAAGPSSARVSGPPPARPPARSAALVEVLVDDGRRVVVDGGTLAVGDDSVPASARAEVVDALCGGGTSFVVLRPCYLALRRALAALDDSIVPRPDAVVLVAEDGRALDATDVARALDIPVCATVQVEPAVARAVDAGMLGARAPRAFGRALAGLAAWEGR